MKDAIVRLEAENAKLRSKLARQRSEIGRLTAENESLKEAAGLLRHDLAALRATLLKTFGAENRRY